MSLLDEHVEDPAPEGVVTKEEVPTSQDPFGDFDPFKDEENGLYFKKYKTPMDVFKGFDEMQKDYGRIKREKSPEAPDKYEISIDESLFPGMKFDEGDIFWGHLEGVLREHNISQDAAQAIMNARYQFERDLIPDPKEEIKQLGSEVLTMFRNVKQFSEKHLDEDEREILEGWLSTADEMRLWSKVMAMTGEKPTPTNLDPSPETDWKELQEEAFKYQTDNPDILYNPTKQQIYHDKQLLALKAKQRQASR